MKIPNEIAMLQRVNKWPKTMKEAIEQNSEPRVPIHVVKKIFPDEHRLVLFAPSFRTLDKVLHSGESAIMSNGEVIDKQKVLVIGDFGFGSDTLLCLYFVLDSENPKVIKETWDNPGELPPVWIDVANNFTDFLRMLELSQFI